MVFSKLSVIHSSSAESGGGRAGLAPGAGRGSLEGEGRGEEELRPPDGVEWRVMRRSREVGGERDVCTGHRGGRLQQSGDCLC